MHRQTRHYFAGRAPTNKDDEESSSSDYDKRIIRKQSGSVAVNPRRDLGLRPIEGKAVSNELADLSVDAKPLRRQRIKAKVIQKSEEPAVSSIGVKKRSRLKIESKVISDDVIRKANDVGKSRSKEELPRFTPVKPNEKSSDDEPLDKVARASSNGGFNAYASPKSASSSGYDSSSGSESGSAESDRSSSRGNSSPQPPTPLLQAPVFVPRSHRVSSGVRGVSEAQARREKEKLAREKKARDEALQAARASRDETEYDLRHVDMSIFPDDTDRAEDHEEEYALWRVRELKRVMRERGLLPDEPEAEPEAA